MAAPYPLVWVMVFTDGRPCLRLRELEYGTVPGRLPAVAAGRAGPAGAGKNLTGARTASHLDEQIAQWPG